jgi:sulfur carrier protein
MKSEPLKLVVNGEPQELQQPCTVAEFLAARGWKPSQVVVEYNGNVLPRNKMETHGLQSGDRLEIIIPVAGG